MRVPNLGASGLLFNIRQEQWGFLRYAHRTYLKPRERQSRCTGRRAVHSVGQPQNIAAIRQATQSSNDDLLRRAQKYGISSIRELEIQSRYLNAKDESQLIQKQTFRYDFHLWQLLLDYQTRNYGTKGVESIYKLLRYPGPLVRLDSENDLASNIWKQMLSVAAGGPQSFDLLDSLCEKYGIARRRPKLFPEVISALLEANRIDKALATCDKLLETEHNRLTVALEIIQAYQPENPQDFSRFFSIYNKLQPLKIYEKALEKLWQTRRKQEAVLLHKFLVTHGDIPSTFESIQRLVVHLAETGQDIQAILSQLSNAGVDCHHNARYLYELTQEEMSVNGTKRLGTDPPKPRARLSRVSDSFAAKAFAAKALPFEFVLNSLKAFGLTEVGPQTIREIGLIAGDLETLMQRLAILRKHEVDTGASAYVRTVRKLCQTGEADLLSEVLNTDIHHDVFEDPHLQRHLIQDYLRNCNWSKLNLLLTMLSCGNVRSPLADVARTALLHRPDRENYQQRSFLNFALKVNGSPTLSNQNGVRDIVKQMIRKMRLQRYERLTTLQQLEWARFMAGLMQEAVLAGHQFEINEWRHVIARIGARGMSDVAIGLTYWLVRLQNETHGKSNGFVPIALDNDEVTITHRAKLLVDENFQRALMHWSLKYSLHETVRKSREGWQNCLEFLRLLEHKYGIPANLQAIQQVMVMRCRYLRPKRHLEGVLAQEKEIQNTVRRSSPDKAKDMDRAAWKECLRLISTLHDLWSVPVEERKADLDAAFQSLFAKKTKAARPFSRQMGALKSEDLEYEY